MATIRAYDGVLAIANGNYIAVANIRSPGVLQTLTLPAEGAIKAAENKDGDKSEENRVLASGFSGQGHYFAACDDQKVLHIYNIKDDTSWTLLSSRLLARRATNLTFTLDEATVVVADKSGDVYTFPTEVKDAGYGNVNKVSADEVTGSGDAKVNDENEADPDIKDDRDGEGKTQGRLLLGHLSMVLDVCLADQDKYVVTCDRDEKIRISHFPNAYNIHNYCLGHTQFVNNITYIPDLKVLVSGSGDCSLRVWSMEGKQLCQAVCSMLEEGGDKSEETKEKMAIQKLLYCRQLRLLVVSFYGFPQLLFYKVTESGSDVSLHLVLRHQLSRDPWDITVDESRGYVWVLSPEEGKMLSAMRLKDVEESLKVDADADMEPAVKQVMELVNAKWEFFSDSLKVTSSIPTLWKNSTQDNVVEYQQRKQQRLQTQQQQQHPHCRQGGKGKKKRGQNNSTTSSSSSAAVTENSTAAATVAIGTDTTLGGESSKKKARLDN